MKINLTLLFLLCSVFTFGQNIDTSRVNQNVASKERLKGWFSGNSALSFQGGIYSFDHKNLNDQLFLESNNRLADNNFVFGASVSSELTVNRRRMYDYHLDVQFLGPKTHEFSDSLSFSTNGFYIGFDICQDLFRKAKRYDFLLGAGFNAGRMKLGRKDLSVSNDFLKYTNPFFLPKIVVEQRFILRSISISVKGEMLFDVTNSKWKRKNDLLTSITGSKATGYILLVTLGLAEKVED